MGSGITIYSDWTSRLTIVVYVSPKPWASSGLDSMSWTIDSVTTFWTRFGTEDCAGYRGTKGLKAKEASDLNPDGWLVRSGWAPTPKTMT